MTGNEREARPSGPRPRIAEHPLARRGIISVKPGGVCVLAPASVGWRSYLLDCPKLPPMRQLLYSSLALILNARSNRPD